MLEIMVGAVLAGVLVVVFRRARPERVLRFWARALFVAAAIYVGFVLVGDAPTQWLFIEGGGLVLFTALAVLGLKYSPWGAGRCLVHTHRMGHLAAFSEHTLCSAVVSGCVYRLRSCSGCLHHCHVQSVA
jgi:hypothetical protein